MINFTKISNFFVLLFFAVLVTGCVDTDFDEPEDLLTISDQDVVSIADVLALMPSSGALQLTDDLVGGNPKYMAAVVTADDASGNFFKNIVFQDQTGALSIIPDQNELNAQYTEGKNIYIKLNGLYLTLDAGTPRLGFAFVDNRLQRIPEAFVSEFMLPGKVSETPIVPEQIELGDFLNDPTQYFNRLVVISNVEFAEDFLGGTYAIPGMGTTLPQTVNTIVQDCNGREVILRNSGFAEFVNELLPGGNGSLTAIASVFNNDLQLFIRDTDDVDFTGTRCDGTTGGGQTSDVRVSIKEVQDAFYVDNTDQAPEGYIEGIVISDRNSGAVNSRNVFIQDGESGILVRFSAAHSFNLGDQVRVVVTGRELSEFNGLLQVNNVPLLNAEVRNTGVALPTPKTLTVSEILADNNRYESTRVLVQGASLSGGSTFAGNVNVNDGTGTISIFTFDNVSFANDPLPSGTVDVVAIVTQFNDNAQLTLNASSDVTGGTTTGGGFPTNEVNIADLRSTFASGGTTAPSGYISGIVVSDVINGNTTGRNLALQNGEVGIVVRLASVHNYVLGRAIDIDVTGLELSEFNGLLQVNSPDDKVRDNGAGTLPTPRTFTVAEILANHDAIESTLVRIVDATISGSATFTGNLTITDGTGSIPTFIRNEAAFAGEAVPTGTVSVVAVVSEFNDPQVTINRRSDVQ